MARVFVLFPCAGPHPNPRRNPALSRVERWRGRGEPASWVSGAIVVGALFLGGCFGAGEAPAPVADKALELEAAPAPERWIKIDKTEHRLWLYEGEQVLREYRVVFGRDPYWPKLHEGDKRTPEGEYHIINKYPHPFWSKFMLLDYPNAMNEDVYTWSYAHGLLPGRGASVPGIGGAIGIHGAEDESKNWRGINWTLGCISLFNADVDELYDMVPIGTRVVIQR